MSEYRFGSLLFLLISLFAFIACGSDNSSQNTDGDIDQHSESDTDTIEDGDIDIERENIEALNAIFGNPQDGKLYAAASRATITPTDENFPCIMYMGGTASNRIVEGKQTELELRLLLLQQNDEYLLIAALDLVGWMMSDVDMLMDELEEQYGVDRTRIIIHSTHTHEAADTLGMYGPDWNITGRCPEYAEYLKDTIIEKAVELSEQMQPVEFFAAETKINEPSSNHPMLNNDTRLPFVTNDHLNVAKLVDESGNVLASIVNWHSHPEAMIGYNEWCADFPHWTRNKVEEQIGGTCLFLSGTVGGLLTPIGLDVPVYDESGEPVLEGGKAQIVTEDNLTKAISLGYIVANYSIEALNSAPKIQDALRVTSKQILLPFESLVFTTAFSMGVLPEYDGFYMDDPDFCGSYGCLPYDMILTSLGNLHMLTLPGELFPELSVGRPESSHDWGTVDGKEWGVMVYPEILGYRSALPDGHILMEFGLANNEIGYILPASDFTMDSHPSHYEEYFSVSDKTAEIIRTTAIEMLEGLEE